MRHLLLSALCVLTFTAQAQRYNNPRTPDNKYEISLLGGKAFNIMNDFSLVGVPGTNVSFNNVRVFRNLGRWQIGLGYNAEVFNTKPPTEYKLTHHSPQLVFNRTQDGAVFSYYAGITIGYTIFNYKHYYEDYTQAIDNKINGGGPMGGAQAGVNIKIYKFIFLNGEIAARIRTIKTTQHIKEYYVDTPLLPYILTSDRTWENKQDDYYVPVMIGLRFKF